MRSSDGRWREQFCTESEIRTLVQLAFVCKRNKSEWCPGVPGASRGGPGTGGVQGRSGDRGHPGAATALGRGGLGQSETRTLVQLAFVCKRNKSEWCPGVASRLRGDPGGRIGPEWWGGVMCGSSSGGGRAWWNCTFVQLAFICKRNKKECRRPGVPGTSRGGPVVGRGPRSPGCSLSKRCGLELRALRSACSCS